MTENFSHYSKPFSPPVPNLEEFTGLIMHSHSYRDPSPFKNLKVAVFGAGPSGTDIALDIASVAEKVFLCHNKPPLESQLPHNLIQKSGIDSAFHGGLILRNGERLEADALLFCTGYQYHFPFLRCGFWNEIFSNIFKVSEIQFLKSNELR